ncbi:hypothetical protein U728_1108 [Clostridium botulinum 202F]|nr:hypothetical protein U728_1108 [Clostridium botulinum 202F]KAI3344388.1 hypothetical protein CIT17_17370 [Clostridium botulinum]KON13561.1 hypothetical protein ACP50_05710 [Clostridium botulinum]MBY6987097.1 hypothetical protein [Clostridium botulinum]NFH02181.1 hypothetical protein [Clostridium botulinum]
MEKQQLTFLKKKYNEKLERNKNAEKYFKEHTVSECINKKFNGKTPLEGFNEIVRDLSKLIIEIEQLTGRKMTQNERLNGFNL